MSTAEPLAPKQERAVATRMKLLNAAVDELVERGYAGLTTSAVAQRAGVSRGAQQRYFPQKDVLVEAAMHHLIERQLDQIRARMDASPPGRTRIQEVLDLLFELYLGYAGQLFAVVIELAFAARSEPKLGPMVAAAEKDIGRGLENLAATLAGPELAKQPGFAECWAVSLATARGLALLRLLGHPQAAVETQWSFTRPKLLTMFMDSVDATAV